MPKQRKIKITPQMKEILRHQRKTFIQKFGCKPRPDDPVFFDPDASKPVSLAPTQLEDATLKAMLAAGAPAHLVYAYQRTGFIVNEIGYKNMSPDDRAEYDVAIDEYLRLRMRRRRGRNSSCRQRRCASAVATRKGERSPSLATQEGHRQASSRDIG